MTKEIKSLTSLRGVAALWVAIGHMSWTLIPEKIIHFFPILRMGYLAVDFFFMLSGFVLAYVYQPELPTFKKTSFTIRRFFRIFPAHLVILAIMGICIFYFGVGNLPPERFNLSTFIQNAFLVQAFSIHPATFFSWNYSAWSLTYEVWVFTILILVLSLLGKRLIALSKYAWLPVIAIILTVFITKNHQMVTDIQSPAWASFRAGLECLSGLLLGIAFRYRTLKTFNGKWVLFFFALTILATYTLPFWISVCMWLVSLFSIIHWCAEYDPKWLSVPGLYHIGVWSFSVYLIHGPLERWIYNNSWGIDPSLYAIIYFGFIAGTILLAWITYTLIEQRGIIWGRKVAGWFR